MISSSYISVYTCSTLWCIPERKHYHPCDFVMFKTSSFKFKLYIMFSISHFYIVCRWMYLGFMNNIFINCSNFIRMFSFKKCIYAFGTIQKSFRFMNDVCIICKTFFEVWQTFYELYLTNMRELFAKTKNISVFNATIS